MGRVETVVLHRENHRFSLEPHEDYYFIHQVVHTFNAATVRDTQEIIDCLSNGGIDLRVFVEPDNHKLIRYSALYGFEYSYTTTSPLGEKFLILERL